MDWLTHDTPLLMLGDCLERMRELPDGCVDAVISDPPYGTTYAPWDCDVSLPDLWAAWSRLLRPGGAVVLTASQPFTSTVVTSNLKQFRCEWIWDKVHAANFANAKRQPLKVHESVLVFCDRQPTYNPVKVPGPKNHVQGRSTSKHTATQLINRRAPDDLSGMKYPKSIQTFAKHSSQCGLHPTQKPLELMDYLVRTYTNPGEVVLDSFFGSCTTGVACVNLGRRFIGIEQDEAFFNAAQERIAVALMERPAAPSQPIHNAA